MSNETPPTNDHDEPTATFDNEPPKDLTPDGGNPSPVLVVLLVIPLLGILAALLMIATQSAQTTNNLSSVNSSANTLIDYPAPEFALRNLDGETVSLDDYTGKTLFLNFWQTTCVPCIEELPAFADFQAEYSNSADVLAVNFNETASTVRDFLRENDIDGVPIVLDPDSRVRSEYGVNGIPTTFIIQADGTINAIRVGAMTVEDMEGYLEQVQTAAVN